MEVRGRECVWGGGGGGGCVGVEEEFMSVYTEKDIGHCCCPHYYCHLLLTWAICMDNGTS